MGTIKSIDFDKFPKQGNYLGKRVKVIFHYNTLNELEGEIVRDDIEEPHQMFIKLDDGRYIRSSECQYQPITL